MRNNSYFYSFPEGKAENTPCFLGRGHLDWHSAAVQKVLIITVSNKNQTGLHGQVSFWGSYANSQNYYLPGTAGRVKQKIPRTCKAPHDTFTSFF